MKLTSIFLLIGTIAANAGPGQINGGGSGGGGGPTNGLTLAQTIAVGQNLMRTNPVAVPLSSTATNGPDGNPLATYTQTYVVTTNLLPWMTGSGWGDTNVNALYYLTNNSWVSTNGVVLIYANLGDGAFEVSNVLTQDFLYYNPFQTATNVTDATFFVFNLATWQSNDGAAPIGLFTQNTSFTTNTVKVVNQSVLTASNALTANYATIAGTVLTANYATTAGKANFALSAPDAPALTQLPNATMQFYAVMNTNMNNAQWEVLQASRQNNFLSFNTHGLVNTAKKIAAGQQISVEIDGSGLADDMTELIVQNLTSQGFNFAGCRGQYQSSCYLNGGTIPGIVMPALTTNWYTQPVLFYTNGCNDYLISAHGFNVLSVEYLQSPVGASYKLQTNIASTTNYFDCGGATWTAVGTNGAVFFWTNNTVISAGVHPQIVQTSPGTNLIINMGAWNTTLTNSFVLSERAHGSSGMANMNAVLTNYVGPIYAAESPDLIIFQSVEGNTASVTTNMQTWYGFYTNWVPKADVVFLGTYPWIPDPPTITEQNSVILTNVIQWYSMGLPVSYWDAESPFGTTNNCMTRNFYGVGAGNSHLSTTGIVVCSQLLAGWLDLPHYRSNYVGSFNGNGSGLTNVTANQLIFGTTNVYIHISAGVVTLTTSP